MTAPARDAQRGAFYAWREGLDAPELLRPMSLGDGGALFEAILDEYLPGKHVATLEEGDRFGYRPAALGWPVYTVPRDTLTVGAVLLLAAAALTKDDRARIVDHEPQQHGPEFARLFLDLAVRYGGVAPERASEWQERGESQRPRRVAFAPSEAVLQPAPAVVREAVAAAAEARRCAEEADARAKAAWAAWLGACRSAAEEMAR
jgi:hypothetical protein